MRTIRPSPTLSGALDRHRRRIVADWVRRVREALDSPYGARSLEELSSWATHGLDAVIRALSEGSAEALEAHANRVSAERSELGFRIHDVIGGLLTLGVAARSHVLASLEPGGADLGSALEILDECFQWIVGRFATLYSEAMTATVERARQRTQLMLADAEAVGGTLELGVVLESVARNISSALGMPYCGIFLAAESGTELALGASVGRLPDGRLRVALDRPLCRERDPLVAEACGRGKLVLRRREDGGGFLAEEDCASLGIEVVVALPIMKGRRLLAMALALDPEPAEALRPAQLEVARGISRNVAAAVDNARLHAETRRQLGESESLRHVTTALLRRVGLSEVMEIVSFEGRKLTGATGGTVALLEGPERLGMVISEGDAIESLESIVLGVCRTNRPLVSRRPGLGGVRSLLGAPLRVDRGVVGVLLLANKPGDFDEQDVRVMGVFAEQAAVAIEHARLQEQRERLAALEERQRLARDLHDSVSQAIYGVSLYTEAAARQLKAGDSSTAVRNLEDARDTALEALREMRLLLYQLRPPELVKAGLAAALRSRLASVEDRAGLVTRLHVKGLDDLTRPLEEGLHRIAQEALNNTLKHAAARTVTIDVRAEGGKVLLTIEDDGRGFEEGARAKGGLGLRSMEERAAELGGRLFASNRPGGGARIAVEVPLARDDPGCESGGPSTA